MCHERKTQLVYDSAKWHSLGTDEGEREMEHDVTVSVGLKEVWETKILKEMEW